MSELCGATSGGCPIAEFCNELRLDQDLEQSTLLGDDGLIDQATDALRLASPQVPEIKQYDDSLFIAMSTLIREHRAMGSFDHSLYNKDLLSLMNLHGISADDLTYVLAGKLAWTAKKAVEESQAIVSGIDDQLAELDSPAVQQACESGVVSIVRQGRTLRMCGSNAISATRREELTRP